MNPCATASPSPTPTPFEPIADALERLEHPLPLGHRDAGAAVDDPEVDLEADGSGLDPDRLLGWRPRDRVVDEVRDRPLQQRRIGVDAGQRLGDVRGDAPVPRSIAEARERGRHDLLDADLRLVHGQGTGCDPAHVEQVRDEVLEPVGLLVDGDAELVTGGLVPIDVFGQQ